MELQIHFGPTRAELRVLDPSNFATLSVVALGAAGRPEDELRALLAPWGSWPGDGHVFVSSDAIRRAVGVLAGDSAWSLGFDQMLQYAERHGWTDELGQVRAHLVDSPS
jgi:hypothetical protein